MALKRKIFRTWCEMKNISNIKHSKGTSIVNIFIVVRTFLPWLANVKLANVWIGHCLIGKWLNWRMSNWRMSNWQMSWSACVMIGICLYYGWHASNWRLSIGKRPIGVGQIGIGHTILLRLSFKNKKKQSRFRRELQGCESFMDKCCENTGSFETRILIGCL